VGGRTYYGGSSYNYYYGRNSYYRGTTFLIVPMYAYGCYSCYGYHRTCYSCDNCRRRQDCAGTQSESIVSNYDRYELDLATQFPASGAAEWPLTMQVSSADIFTQRASGSSLATSAVYIGFNTDAGDQYLSLSEMLSPIGFLLAIGISVCFCISSCKERIWAHNDDDAPRAFTTSTPFTTPHAVQEMQPYPAQPYPAQPYPAQPYQAQPYQAQGYGVQPQAYGQTQVAQMPVAQACGSYAVPAGGYPAQPFGATQGISIAQAVAQPYPGQQPVAMAVAYPSNPPSPPSKHD